MTRRLAKHFDMTGIDVSADMLMAAREMDSEGILYLCQDMREFELYGTMRAIVSFCDSINYLCSEADLAKVFSLVHNYLDIGGIFLFDMNTLFKYEEILSDNVFAENRDEGSFIWENNFDTESRVNIYDLTLYLRTENGQYERFEEQHIQRAYDTKQVIALLEEAGLQFLEVLDTDTLQNVTPTTERVYYIARRIK